MRNGLSAVTNLCLYEDAHQRKGSYPQLNQPLTTDVCIIGGGFTGLATALHLINSGLNVCLIEAQYIGYGASGRNGGEIIPGFNQDLRHLAKKYGVGNAQKMFLASVEAVNDIKNNMEKFSPDCQFSRGVIIPALSDKAVEDQAEYTAFLKSLCNYHTEVKSKQDTDHIVGSDIYAGAMEDNNIGRFNPRRYIDDLASYCAENGIQIFENTPAVKIDKGSSGYTDVVTEHGTIKATKVVLAVDAYQKDLFPSLRKKFVITKTYMIATEPLSNNLLEKILPQNHSAFEWRVLTNYYAKTLDNRVVFGGVDSAANTDEEKLLRCLKDNLLTVFPSLEETKITHFWGGNLAVTSNQTPEIDHIDHKIFYAYGYSGHGIVPSHMAGKIIAGQIQDKHAFNVMKPFKPRTIPGGGLLDNSIAKLGLQWYKVKEFFE